MERRKVDGIARDTLEFILEASKAMTPDDFASLLIAEDKVVDDVIILPGTESSRMTASIKHYMLPNMRIVGSAHSHPTSNISPSKEDLFFFLRSGDYHIIAGPPFTEKNWACYDAEGERRVLPVIDVEFEDEGL